MHSSFIIHHSSFLLLGPTGSGKTPLGDYFEQNGWNGKRCLHFDFGENLRKIAACDVRQELFSARDLDVVRLSLESGALLEKENFYIAKNVLLSFLDKKASEREDIILLNGLPRHIEQAEDVDRLVDIDMVLCLECSPEVVYERIKQNSGGDRTERIDDSKEEIQRKLKIFYERTLPLLDHYHAKRVTIERIEVTADTTPEDVGREIRDEGRREELPARPSASSELD
ncbi:nucleoside monophosphate kinase [Verrucomicrobiota bacterium]